MPRKTNPEQDVVSSPASAAAARPRRAPTVTRTQHSAMAAETSAPPARVPGPSVPADAIAVARELSHEEIARLAYSLWEARGRQGGNPEDDWLQAEQQLRERILAPTA